MKYRSLFCLAFLMACGPKKNPEVAADPDPTILPDEPEEIKENMESCQQGKKRSCRKLEKACDEGDTWGCFRAGMVHISHENGYKIDVPKAKELFGKSCDLNLVFCSSIGDLYTFAGFTNLEEIRDYETGAAYMQKACDGGMMMTCSALGVNYSYIQEMQDYEKAKVLFETACDGGWFGGCLQLIFVYEEGLGVQKDIVKVKQYQRKTRQLVTEGCENGEEEFCEFLPSFDERYPPVKRRNNNNYLLPVEPEENRLKLDSCNDGEQEACDWLENACQEGEPMACVRAGWSQTEISKARELNQRACDLDLALCHMIGDAYIGRLGFEGAVIKDIETGLAYMQRACDGGFIGACHDIGTFYHDIQDPKEPSKARAILEGTCGDGYAQSCSYLVDIYEYGYNVQKDELKAKEYREKQIVLLEKRCESGDISSCFGLALFYYQGKSFLNKDPAKGEKYLEMLKKECEAGDEGWCSEVQRLETFIEK